MPRYFIPAGPKPHWGWADNIETVEAWAALQDLRGNVFESVQQGEFNRRDNGEIIPDTFDFRVKKDA